MFGLADLGIVETLGCCCRSGLVVLYQLRQRFIVNPKGERLEVPIMDVHRRDGTYIPVEIILCNLQDGFGFVIEFRSQMAARVVVAFVQVQDGMDMDFALVRSLHQFRDEVGRFTGTIDVVRQIADAVDHDQSEAVDFIDSLLDLLQPVFSRKTAQA